LKTRILSLLFLLLIIFQTHLYSGSSIALGEEPETSHSAQTSPHNRDTTDIDADIGASITTEAIWFGFEEKITIATKRETPISKAPGIVIVITAEEIKNLGFRTLTDVLKTVPGIDISMDRVGNKLIGVRGVLESFSPKVKVLIDGHSINDPFTGGATWGFHDLVVENAKRIEIIRGPGSALYGQNAFLAVINVVTKDTDDIDGFQWTTSGGSFDTQNYNMLFGKEYGDLKVSGFLDYFDTEGHSEKVEQDILSPAPFSMAPGRSQNAKEKTDLDLKLSYKNLEIKSKYLKFRREHYTGNNSALSDETKIWDSYISSELIYKLFSTEKLKIVPRVYYDQYNDNNFIETRPEGFVDMFGRVFPDGMNTLVRSKFRIIGFENQLNYTVFEGNELTFGFQYEWEHLHDIKFAQNFNPLTFAPLSTLTDFSKDLPPFRKATRQIWAFYLQDEWSITDDLDLTVGVRHDQFTRFGGTTNPRFGLIWRFMKDAHMKLLFATAFRAPNFQEMFLVNNPILIGNPNLDPEKINTFEAGLGYNFTRRIKGNINFFYNRIRDRIVLGPLIPGRPQQFENSGGARAKGIEAEIRADFGKDSYAYANYTFQDAEETGNRNRLPDVPIHKANFGLNAGLSKYVNANIHTFLSGPRPRENGDTRRDMPSYALVDFTLIGKNFMDNFEIRSSVFNLFDKGYEDPAPQNTVPTDYPQQGRSFMVELRYEF
jgi:outer membrane receptor for ferrienterochelin and colicins